MNMLGVTIIGTGMLKDLGEKQFDFEARAVPRQRPRQHALRQSLAVGFRTLASRLEPQPLTVNAQQPSRGTR